MAVSDPEIAFITALAKRADEALCTTGRTWLYDHDLRTVSGDLGISGADLGRLVIRLEGRGLIGVEGPDLYEAMPLAAVYEEQLDREEFRRRNVARREVLEMAARAFEEHRILDYNEGQHQFSDRPWLEWMVILRYLHYHHLVQLDEFMGHNFTLEITDDGLRLTSDPSELRQRLPTSAREDGYLSLRP